MEIYRAQQQRPGSGATVRADAAHSRGSLSFACDTQYLDELGLVLCPTCQSGFVQVEASLMAAVRGFTSPGGRLGNLSGVST